MSKKHIITLIICLSIGILFVLVYFLYENKDTKEVMKATIYSSECEDETYYFVLYSNNILKVYFGEKQPYNSVASNSFLKKVYKKRTKRLKKQEFQTIINQVMKIKKTDNKHNIGVNDGSIVEVYYNGRLYKMAYCPFKNPETIKKLTDDGSYSDSLQKLIDKIINLSPIPVKLSSI